jgi:hypothetical protein
LVCGALVSLASVALGQAQAQPINAKPQVEQMQPRPANGYWSEGAPRWFVASRSELGLPYIKPYFSAGYGLPHWIWAGADLNAIITREVIEVFSGLRLSSPVFDVSFGIRDNWSLVRPFLKPADSYNRAEVLGATGPRAQYWAAELDALAIVPLPYSAIGANFVWVDVWDVPRGQYVYEESYRLITKRRSFMVVRFAALARALKEGALKVGVLAEHGWGTGRGKGVWRAGPVLSVQLTDHLQFNLAVTLKVSSPDALGLALGAFGTAGFRYQWATGERRPELPWQGDLIPFEP